MIRQNCSGHFDLADRRVKLMNVSVNEVWLN